ncbi:MAG: hypothetical protein PHV82_16955 [Victivallaceae bacterium]|nr:hypothetical protein [Victivallaceae bacterium]
MPKIKSLVVPVLLALATAVLVTGCSLFSSDSTTTSERLATAKTVAKTVLKAVCTAYSSGGNTLAEAQINSMVSDGKLTEAQATVLKSMLDGGISTLENLANSTDSAAVLTNDSTVTNTGEATAVSENKE